MMRAPRFLRRTELAGLDLVTAGGAPVLERHERLAQLLAERAGPAAAELFAEPVLSRGHDRAAGSVSWYTSLTGEPVALAAVPASERARAEAALRQSLAALEPLHADAELGPLLQAAFVVPSLDNVLLLDGRPVLTGWGLAPSA